MTKTLVAIAVAMVALSASTGTAEAGFFKKLCNKSGRMFSCETITFETCRRYFSQSKKCFGCHKTVRFVEITYQTNNKFGGSTKVWSKVYRS